MAPVPSYGWVPHEVGQYLSCFNIRYSLEELTGRVALVKAAEDVEHFNLTICKKNELVFHGKEGVAHDFFYAYSCLFKDLLVRLPSMASRCQT